MRRENGNIIIQKYGGSSVESPERLKEVARRIIQCKEAGDHIVVVVSAMGNTTDELIELAHRISPVPARRELDMLLSVGERISMTLLSMAINDLGHKAISFTGSQSGIITDERHTNARIVEVRASRILEELEKDKVVIVAGYQGVSRSKEVTTLGRGGSDTTAIALAAALGARVCEIYTDVDGVYTADPGLVKDAKKHTRLSYDEMLSLSAAGGTILKKDAMEFAKSRGIRVVIRSSFSEDPGTEIGMVEGGVTSQVIAVTQQLDLVALLFDGMKTREKILEFIRDLNKEGVEVRDFILDCSDAEMVADHLFLAISASHEFERNYVENAAKRLLAGHGHRLFECGSVSIVASADSYLPELYCRILQLLQAYKIRTYGMKKEFAAITAYIERKDAETALSILHRELVQ